MIELFLKTLWPFLKELFAGESDISKAIRRNKLATVLFVSVIALFIEVIYMTDQMIEHQEQSFKDRKEITELKSKVVQLENFKKEPCPVMKPIPLSDPKPKPKKPKTPEPVILNNLQQKLNELKEEESK